MVGKISALLGGSKVTAEEVGGVRVRHSLRARKMSLSFDVKGNDVVLVMPRRASLKSAENFVSQHQDWVEKTRARICAKTAFADGAEISIYGQNYIIEHRVGRGVSRIEGDKLIVHGRAEFLGRRVKDFLKKEAEERIQTHLEEKLQKLDCGKSVTFRVIDPKSRWGSCAAGGKLMFSWRLVLMPVSVLDYIVAHEAAHLKHMNHSDKFWRLCQSLTDDADAAREWIRRHGTEIMGYR